MPKKVKHGSTPRIPLPDDTDTGKVYWPLYIGDTKFKPFGYKPDPDNKYRLLPDEHELALWEQAKEYRKRGFGYEEIARWLTANSDRSISGAGVKHRIQQDQGRRREALNKRQNLKRLVRNYVGAKRVEQKRLCGRYPEEKELLEMVMDEFKEAVREYYEDGKRNF